MLEPRQAVEPEDPLACAGRLRERGLPAGYPGTRPGDVVPDRPVDLDAVRETLQQLDARQVGMLVRAVLDGDMVRIRYRTTAGVLTDRDVLWVRILPPHLYGLCQTRCDDTRFNLRGIVEVLGVEPGPLRTAVAVDHRDGHTQAGRSSGPS